MKLEERRISFGMYKHLMFKELPVEYLTWGIRSGAFKGRLLLYAKRKTNFPKDTYEVTVDGSANKTDGTYIVKAHSNEDAISTAQREHFIQNTQSFHGTDFTVIKVSNETSIGLK